MCSQWSASEPWSFFRLIWHFWEIFRWKDSNKATTLVPCHLSHSQASSSQSALASTACHRPSSPLLRSSLASWDTDWTYGLDHPSTWGQPWSHCSGIHCSGPCIASMRPRACLSLRCSRPLGEGFGSSKALWWFGISWGGCLFLLPRKGFCCLSCRLSLKIWRCCWFGSLFLCLMRSFRELQEVEVPGFFQNFSWVSI